MDCSLIIFMFLPDLRLFFTTNQYCAVLCLVAQSCPTLRSHESSLPGSSVHGDSPSKSTGVGCHALLRGSYKPRDQTQVSHITSRFFTSWTTREAQSLLSSRVCPNSCPLSRWCHPTISSSVAPSPLALSLSHHQGFVQWLSSSHQVVKVQLQHQSFQWIFRIDLI